MESKDKSFILILLMFSVVLVVVLVAEGPEYFTKPLVHFPKLYSIFLLLSLEFPLSVSL